MVDVLLVAFDARQTLAVADAAEPEGTIFRQLVQKRESRILSALHLVAQEVQHGRQDIDLARQPLYALAIPEPSRGVDHERYPQALLIGGVAVHKPVVLAEAFPMIAEEDEDGVVI